MQLQPDQFREEDLEIVNQNDITKYHLLSNSSCKYSKNLITKYTEKMWSDSLRNEFLNEGHSIVPQPSCSPLEINRGTDRKTEVMMMSMFYDNNLLNAFLHRLNIPEVSSSLCHCGVEDQTPYHILFRCEQVNQDLRSDAMNCVRAAAGEEESTVVLLNLSRDESFMNILKEIVTTQKHLIRSTIQLN